MSNYDKSVNHVYEELNKCIIIGLTGRTGSGCTTVSNLLNIESFKELNSSLPKQRDYNDVDERKYGIVYKYMCKNWQPFVSIEVSSVILSFLFEYKYDDFKQYIMSLSKENSEKEFRINGEQELFRKLEGLKGMFDSQIKLSNLNEDAVINTILSQKDEVEKYYKYFTYTIKEYKKSFFTMFKDYSCFEKNKSNFNSLAEKKSQLYTYLMQLFGNNLRSSSKPYENKFNENSFDIIAKRIDVIIAIIKEYNQLHEIKSTRICIDALRNPFEAHYLKDKHKSFYLISVSTDDDERRRRLSYLDSTQLLSLDEMEYPSKQQNSGEVFYQQSIAECLQISDIHLYNPHSNNAHYELLIKNLIRYIALMLHPGLITPSSIERCMQTAFNAKFNSGCLSRQVGAVITNEDYYIKAIGWNDVPQGQIPCNLRSLENYFSENDSKTFSDFELQNREFLNALKRINKLYESTTTKETYNIPYCFKDVYNGLKSDKNQVYTRALHAEENAFLQASKFGGQGIKGGKLFVTASPCELCSKKAYQLGIKEIYYIDPYPGISSSHILKLGDSQYNPKLKLFYGAVGNAFVSLYEQRFPLKDELNLRSGVNMKKESNKSSVIKQLEYDDVNNNNVDLCLTFNNRNEIDFIRHITITPKKDGIRLIQKGFSWTGSSYDKTIIIDDHSQYDLKDEFCVDGINYYTLEPKDSLKKNVPFEYNLKTIVRDECEVMIPIFSYHIKSITEHLKMTVKFKKNVSIENIVIKKYADINKNIVFEKDKIDKGIENGEYIEYVYETDNPYLFYTYSIEWEFIKKR